MNSQYPRWICPENKRDKPVQLYRDEFTMQLLQIASEEDTLVVIDYFAMKATFDKSGTECNITSDRLVDTKEAQKIASLSNSTTDNTPD